MTWVYLPKSVCSQDMVGSPLVSNLPRSPARPSAMSSVTSSASNSSSSASSMGSLTTLPFGTMSQPSTGDLGVDRWILSLQGSRASRTPTPENALARRIAGISGLTRAGLYGKWDPGTSSWRMSEDWLTGLTRSQRKSLGVFPRQGMMRCGVCTALPKRVRHILDGDGGVWPTPSSSQARSEGMIRQMRSQVDLGVLTVQEAEEMIGGSLTPARMRQYNLRDQVAVEEGMRMWPTPRVDARAVKAFTVEVGGQLNPTWVEWLMGLPIGWTDLEPLAMESYRLWWQSFLGT